MLSQIPQWFKVACGSVPKVSVLLFDDSMLSVYLTILGVVTGKEVVSSLECLLRHDDVIVEWFELYKLTRLRE